MTRQETERLARVEQHLQDQDKKIDRIENKVDTLITNFATLSGGKQALIWGIGILMSGAVIVSTWIGFHK